MFTHPLVEDDDLIRVEFSNYSKKHFLKHFEKTYKGRQWQFTVDSIIEDIGRIKIRGYSLQFSQQVDELWHKDDCWIFKYDFTVASTKKSAKASGNRCIVFMDTANNYAQILAIYHKSDLPKNLREQQWIVKLLQSEFPNLLAKVQ